MWRIGLLSSLTIMSAGLLRAPLLADEMPSSSTERYSISGAAPLPITSGFTLLEPTWILPPIETLGTIAQLTSKSTQAETLLRDDAMLAPGPPKPIRPAGPLAYPLSDALTAQLRYRKPQTFVFSRSQTVRDDPSSAFSTQPNRDVFDLSMSWHLDSNTVGLGYELQSSAHGPLGGGESGLARFMPGSEQATHAVSLGFTREWGRGNNPANQAETPLVLDDAYLAALLMPDEPVRAEPEPTPTP